MGGREGERGTETGEEALNKCLTGRGHRRRGIELLHTTAKGYLFGVWGAQPLSCVSMVCSCCLGTQMVHSK